MELKQCNVYIHDLDIKQEAKARRLLVMSGSAYATSVRFIQDLEKAHIWILAENSAFIRYARKHIQAHQNKLWAFQHNCLYDISQGDKIRLDTGEIAQAISQLIERTLAAPQKASTQNTKTAETQQSVADITNTSEVAYRINKGMLSKRGNLCIGYKEAVFYFDFSQLTVKYNNAGYDALWSNNTDNITLADLSIYPQIPSEAKLSKGCSTFSAIWQMTHRLQDAQINHALIKDCVLTLHTWPPFEQVKHQLDDYRIASLLQKRPLSAEQVCQLLDLPYEVVCMFFNAIYLCASGSFTTQTKKNNTNVTVTTNKKTHSLVGLWRRVRDTVGV